MECNDDVIVTSAEVHEAILKLSMACGQNDSTAEHIKLASKKLYPLVALCFTCLLVNGVLPVSKIK